VVELMVELVAKPMMKPMVKLVAQSFVVQDVMV